MRCWWTLAIVSCAFRLPPVPAVQVQWSSVPARQSTTLVDALSADPDYTSLVRLLQRARLIPTLNRLNGSTLFAPTNDAIERHAFHGSIWRNALDSDDAVDNTHEELRQQLFYHLLNYSLPGLPSDIGVQTHKTLLFPRAPIERPSPQPTLNPPWLPIPDGTLGGEPQRLRMTSRDGGVRVGTDAFGVGGGQSIKGVVNTSNGVLVGITEFLDMPPSLFTVVSKLSPVSYFNTILTPEIAQFLNNTAKLTLFLPRDDAWTALHPLERLYLQSEYANDDLRRILNMHATVEQGVKWSDTFQSGINLTTIDGRILEIKPSANETTVSHAKLIHPDIYASNGVLHLVDSLLIPHGALQLTAEKYLLALNCTTFVSLLHSVDLMLFINNTEAKYTILAPRDDVLSIFGEGELPERGSDELKAMLQYHFLPGRWTTKNLKDRMLLETALEEPGLKGGKQVLGIAVHDGSKKPEAPWKQILFGGVGVIDEPIEINDTVIYFVSRPLRPPSDVLQTALPLLDLSSFLAAIFSTSLADLVKSAPSTTFLIPHNSAFKRIGTLVREHLLGSTSKTDLEQVILHHVIDGVQYTQQLQNGSQHTFPTLEGSDIQFNRLPNGSVFISGSGGWTGMISELYPKDHLTRTGVVHELSDLLLPRSMNLTIGKLMKAAKGSTMASLMTRAGLDWILNGNVPPEGSPWVEEGLSTDGWTLLCPTDSAFKDVNLTLLYADDNGLRDIVRQHLIPTPKSQDPAFLDALSFPNDKPLPFDGETTFATLLTAFSSYGDIVFRNVEEGGERSYVVGIKGARGTDGKGDVARVMAWGRSTTGHGTGGVIQINRLLVPYCPPWWVAYGAPAFVGVSGIFAIGAFFYGVRVVWQKDTTEATYEPVGGFGRDDDD